MGKKNGRRAYWSCPICHKSGYVDNQSINDSVTSVHRDASPACPDICKPKLTIVRPGEYPAQMPRPGQAIEVVKISHEYSRDQIVARWDSIVTASVHTAQGSYIVINNHPDEEARSIRLKRTNGVWEHKESWGGQATYTTIILF